MSSNIPFLVNFRLALFVDGREVIPRWSRRTLVPDTRFSVASGEMNKNNKNPLKKMRAKAPDTVSS